MLGIHEKSINEVESRKKKILGEIHSLQLIIFCSTFNHQ